MTPNKRMEEIAERIATTMDGRTVTSHEHYREMLKKELVYELTKYHQDIMSEVLKDIDLPWLFKEQERGEFQHVTSELGRLIAKYEPLSN